VASLVLGAGKLEMYEIYKTVNGETHVTGNDPTELSTALKVL